MSSTEAGGLFGLLTSAATDTAAESATGDAALLRALVAAETALARAQGAPREAVEAIAAAGARLDVREMALRARAGGNPVIPLAEALRGAVGAPSARYVHRGATSQDILDTALMLVAARTRRLILADLERTATALARLAAEHRDTVMPGRTLTQHAVPTTFGLKAAGWRSLVLDARDRLAAVRLPAQLGGAAGTLAALGGAAALAHAAAYARELGLTEPVLPWHTLRTPVADLGCALAFACSALGKTAVDVLTLSRTEVAEVAEGSGGASSAMPHKANPVHATLVAAAARQAPAHLSVLLCAVPAEDERPAGAWHAEWTPLRELLRLAGGSAEHTAQLASGLRIFPDRMARNLSLTGGLIVSERFATELGKQEVGKLIDRAAAADAPFAEVAEAAGFGDLLPPERWSGAAGALVDRALERT
ncbi:3-carboxy-cis,cis-muconate cycloisomerase [Streptomyces sp. NBC_01497]|uniref:3-carboxy-cis,cis-muconate cycloisomerase n=1 Tax=Streptomyces sp. NBC_01497 TaxID=2903885 RepID=UPI002E3674D9|nr:3-carboxy-cis,cis-muconate cycloisomerase [Streptomyces sp. NBC_01497]